MNRRMQLPKGDPGRMRRPVVLHLMAHGASRTLRSGAGTGEPSEYFCFERTPAPNDEACNEYVHWRDIMAFFATDSQDDLEPTIFFPNTCNSFQKKVKLMIAEEKNPFVCMIAWTIPVYNPDALWMTDVFVDQLLKCTDDKQLLHVAQNTWDACNEWTDPRYGGNPHAHLLKEFLKCKCQPELLAGRCRGRGGGQSSQTTPRCSQETGCITVKSSTPFSNDNGNHAAIAWPGKSYDERDAADKKVARKRASAPANSAAANSAPVAASEMRSSHNKRLRVDTMRVGTVRSELINLVDDD